MNSPLKFPEIRQFHQSGTFQSMPVLAEGIIGGPDFHSQSEAAYASICFRRLLNYPEPEYATRQEITSLDPAKKAVVEQKVKDIIRMRQLQPLPARQEPAPARPPQELPTVKAPPVHPVKAK